MDAEKFYARKFRLINNILASIQEAKENLSSLSDFEEQNADDPDMSELYPLGATLDLAVVEVEGLLDSVAALM